MNIYKGGDLEMRLRKMKKDRRRLSESKVLTAVLVLLIKIPNMSQYLSFSIDIILVFANFVSRSLFALEKNITSESQTMV